MDDAKQAKWRTFCEYWNANFRAFGTNDGASQWFEFVGDDRTDLGVIKVALAPMAQRFARQLEDGKFAPLPTLAAVKNRYFELVKQRKQERERAAYGNTVCGLCRGAGLLFVLAPRQADREIREEWPEDFRLYPWAEMTGFETVKCPDCRGKNHPHELAERIRRNSMPVIVGRDHDDFPRWLPDAVNSLGGDQAMSEIMRQAIKRL